MTADAEEVEAKLLQKQKRKQQDESDFGDSFGRLISQSSKPRGTSFLVYPCTHNPATPGDGEAERVQKNLSSLSASERLEVLLLISLIFLIVEIHFSFAHSVRR